jgi:glycosyltransferase involved in cell wall biosynthesis
MTLPVKPGGFGVNQGLGPQVDNASRTSSEDDMTSVGEAGGRVSVVMPTFKNAQYIGQALDSVLDQTRAPFEIIVINDGSPDDTDVAVGPYLDRITYLKQPNQGIAITRNRGVQLATGEYIKFVDSDDWLPADAIERLGEVLDAYPQVGLAYGRSQRADEDGVLTAVRKVEEHRVGKHRDFAHMLDRNFIPTSAALCRRTALIDSGLFRPYMMGSDWAMWLWMMMTGWEAYGLDDVTFFYRRHGGNITAQTNQAREYRANLLMLGDLRDQHWQRFNRRERAAMRRTQRRIRRQLGWLCLSRGDRSLARWAFVHNVLNGPDVDSMAGLGLAVAPSPVYRWMGRRRSVWQPTV